MESSETTEHSTKGNASETPRQSASSRSESGREPSRGKKGAESDTDELLRAANDLQASVGEIYRSSEEFISKQAKERPYALLGAAAGIGFILGGGLASRGTGLLLSLGSRMLMNRVLDGSFSVALEPGRGSRG